MLPLSGVNFTDGVCDCLLWIRVQANRGHGGPVAHGTGPAFRVLPPRRLIETTATLEDGAFLPAGKAHRWGRGLPEWVP